mgnify:CR=1 FL=1
MRTNQLFDQIESVTFAIRYSVLSSFKIVKLGLQTDERLDELIREMQNSPEGRQKVFERLLMLLKENPHPEYAHPKDEALVGYLYGLSHTDDALTLKAIESILLTPKLWWAKQLADELLRSRVFTSNENVFFKIIEPKVQIHTQSKQVNSEYQLGWKVSRNISVVANSNLTTSSKPIEKQYGSAPFLKERIS